MVGSQGYDVRAKKETPQPQHPSPGDRTTAVAAAGRHASGIFRMASWICWNWWVTALEM